MGKSTKLGAPAPMSEAGMANSQAQLHVLESRDRNRRIPELAGCQPS